MNGFEGNVRVEGAYGELVSELNSSLARLHNPKNKPPTQQYPPLPSPSKPRFGRGHGSPSGLNP